MGAELGRLGEVRQLLDVRRDLLAVHPAAALLDDVGDAEAGRRVDLGAGEGPDRPG